MLRVNQLIAIFCELEQGLDMRTRRDIDFRLQARQ